MKKLVLMLMLFAPMAMFAQKFGHVNAQEVMASMPEFLKAKGDIEASAKKYENELTATQEEVKRKSERTPNLFRVVGSSDDVNAFWGENVAWVAGRANLGNIDKVDGNMLTVRGKTTVNGKEEVVDQIVAKYCSVANTPAKAGKPAPKKSAGKAKR